MLNLCQISSLVAAADVPVAEFSSFENFKERKRKKNLLMSFPKIVHQKCSFGQIRKKSLFCFCQPILDIFGLTLLIILTICFMTSSIISIVIVTMIIMIITSIMSVMSGEKILHKEK